MAKVEGKPNGDESSRMWASASFVGVLIVIGMPLWWKTTEVYRVALPYDKISAFDPLALSLTSELTVLADDEATASDLAARIRKAYDDSDILKLKVNKAVLSDSLRNVLNSVSDEQEATEEVGKSFDLQRPDTMYVVQRKPLKHDVWLGADRVLFFKDSAASETVLRVLWGWVYEPDVLRGARAERPDAWRRGRTPAESGYHVLLSVLQPAPHKLTLHFPAQEAVEDYIGSFVDDLSDLHNFTLKSQWLYLLDFDFQAKKVLDPEGVHFATRAERLPQLVSRLEERTGTHVSAHRTLNLVLYVVPCQHAPLVIYDAQERKNRSPVQAFMSPKWGGVVLASPGAELCGAERPRFAPDPKPIMGAFVAQLRELLGITPKKPIEGAELCPLRSVRSRVWERDAARRTRTVEQLAAAQRTLHSLAQLLGEISNIVIREEVGWSITSAVEALSQPPSLQSARLAREHAERAFNDPSLLALLYFPDDQKYAIYIPLFLPIMFPVVLSLKNLFLWFRGKPIHKEKTD